MGREQDIIRGPSDDKLVCSNSIEVPTIVCLNLFLISNFFAFKCCHGGCECPNHISIQIIKIKTKYKKLTSIVSQKTIVEKSTKSQPKGSDQGVIIGEETR